MPLNIPGLTPVHNDSIMLPDGSVRSVRETQAARAVAEYDEDLFLGRNKVDGQWAVFMKTGEGARPVLGLGFDLPTPEKIKERLYRSDTQRHGGQLAIDVAKRNEAAQLSHQKKADDATREVVEHFEWGLRKLGSHHAPRIFVPSGKDSGE